jgi:hypothetical protein
MVAFAKDTLGWGILVWLMGYILGFVFFALVPSYAIGYFVTPLGVAFTLWVLFKKVKSKTFAEYVAIGAVWTILAMALDYIFILLLLHPTDGYYKFDVYLYYTLAFLLPVMVGWYKVQRTSGVLVLDDE